MSPPSLEQSNEAFSSVDLQYSHVMQDGKSPLLAQQWAVQGQRPSWSNQLDLIWCSWESAPPSDAQMFWLFYHICGEERRGDVKEMTSVSDLEQLTSCLGPVLRVQSALWYYPLLSAMFKRQGHNQREKASSQSGLKWTLGHCFKSQALSEIFSISILKALDTEGRQAEPWKRTSFQSDIFLHFWVICKKFLTLISLSLLKLGESWL